MSGSKLAAFDAIDLQRHNGVAEQRNERMGRAKKRLFPFHFMDLGKGSFLMTSVNISVRIKQGSLAFDVFDHKTVIAFLGSFFI